MFLRVITDLNVVAVLVVRAAAAGAGGWISLGREGGAAPDGRRALVAPPRTRIPPLVSTA